MAPLSEFMNLPSFIHSKLIGTFVDAIHDGQWDILSLINDFDLNLTYIIM